MGIFSKRFTFICVLGLSFFSTKALFGQERHVLRILPIDFQDDGQIKAFPTDIRQIERGGDRIYLRSKKDPYVTMIDKTGKILGKIGQSGAGPGEIDQGILAMALYGNHLWIQGVNKRGFLQHYFQGEYVEDIAVDSMNMSIFSTNSNVFAVSEKEVVFPVSPRTGYLAQVYPFNGEKKLIGELYFDRRDSTLVEKIPCINDSNWLFHDRYYYCLFRFFPLILKFDKRFKRVAAYNLDIPYVQELYVERVADFKPTKRIKKPIPLFFDFKADNQFLYAMTYKALIRINAETGTITDIFQFYGDSDTFDGPRGEKIHVRQFTVLSDKTLMLSGAFHWGHDLWYTRIPD